MIDADSYLTQLVGYIHLNPVRAGMVARCEEYEWSSHQTYVGNNIIPWLTTETVLSQFSGNAANGRRLFHEFVRDQQEGHNPEFHGAGGFDSRIFGGDRFIDDVLNQVGSQPQQVIDVGTVIKAVELLYKIQGEELSKAGQNRRFSEARSMAAWGVTEMSSSTLTELAGKMCRDVTTLSSGAKQLQIRAIQNPELIRKMLEFKRLLLEVAMLHS